MLGCSLLVTSVCFLVIVGVVSSSKGALELHAFPPNTMKKGHPLSLKCTFTSSSKWGLRPTVTASCSFLWSHSPSSGDGVQRIFTSSTAGVTISTSRGVVSTLTIQYVDEGNAGLYTCHLICGQHHFGSRIKVDFKGSDADTVTDSNDLQTEQDDKFTTDLLKRKATPLEKYGGLIALGGLAGLLFLTGLCAVKVSNLRLCRCCNRRNENSESDDNNSASATDARSRGYSDDPPAYESVINHTTRYFSGMVQGFFGLTSGLPWGRSALGPKCARCGRRSSVAHRRNQFSDSRLQGATSDNPNSPSYIHVCCENVPSPVEKPPDYWAWMKDQKTKDVFTFETPPPLYHDVANQVPRTVLSGATGMDNPAVIIKSSSVSQSDRQTIKPSLARSLSET